MNDSNHSGTRAVGDQDRGLRFLEAFIRKPLTVGSLWPSSIHLSRAVVGACDFAADDTVVEFGPGTGSFTELLLQRLGKRGRLLALEITLTNVEMLRHHFPRCEVVHDSAENLAHHLNGKRAACIVSGLAWGNMLPKVQDRIFEAILNSLAPDGQFVAFAYVHARWFPTTLCFRRLMFRGFERVETTPIVWRNLPPAYVYRCWRPRSKTDTRVATKP